MSTVPPVGIVGGLRGGCRPPAMAPSTLYPRHLSATLTPEWWMGAGRSCSGASGLAQGRPRPPSHPLPSPRPPGSLPAHHPRTPGQDPTAAAPARVLAPSDPRSSHGCWPCPVDSWAVSGPGLVLELPRSSLEQKFAKAMGADRPAAWPRGGSGSLRTSPAPTSGSELFLCPAWPWGRELWSASPGSRWRELRPEGPVWGPQALPSVRLPGPLRSGGSQVTGRGWAALPDPLV